MPTEDETPHIQNMSLPCPHDICDGSGKVLTEEGYEYCLCQRDKDEDQYDPDRDY